MFENCLFLVAQHMVEYEMTGRKPRSMPEREHAWPIYDIFDTAGGDRIFIGVVTEGHWWSFCKEFGLQEFADDPSLRNTTDRILARARIIPRVAEVIKGWNTADLSAKLDELNICFSPINRPEDLLGDPHVLRPGGLVQNFNADGAPFRVPALPVERRLYRRRAEGAGAWRRHRGHRRRTRQTKTVFNRQRRVRLPRLGSRKSIPITR
ncbi:CoA transferase [Bradyrhizobium sp. TZ2]